MKKKNLVYSTDQGRLCPDCGQAVNHCCCSDSKQVSAGDGIVRLHRESKGRGGKPVTLISGLGLSTQDMKSLAKDLKARCGTGGSIDGDRILIQGDRRQDLKPLLESRGFTVKIAGG